MIVRFIPEALNELREVMHYYNQRKAGLGVEFRDEVDQTLDRIVRMPRAWPVVSRGFRRCQTHRFPYGIIYRVRRSEIQVMAVMHLKRESSYWKGRA